MRALLSALGVALPAMVLVGCNQAPRLLPSNDFNRPTDLAFMCLGAFDPSAPTGAEEVDAGAPTDLQLSGRPMRWCHPPGPANVRPDPGGTLQTRTFAFMPNSASGELSVIDADTWKIVDLDPSTGGYGRLPLGTVPEQISVSDDGCRLLSANRGATYVTLVDPATLLAPVFNNWYAGALAKPLPDPRTAVQRISPRRPDGSELGVAPYEVAFLPTDTSGLNGATNLCPTGGAAPATPWKALVTFPSCDLIALVELPSGDILDSARVVAAGDSVKLEPTGRSPSCGAAPGGNGGVDAGTEAGSTTTTDGGSDDGGGDDATNGSEAGADDGGGAGPLMALEPIVGTFRPASIAIVPDGTRAYLSLSSFSAVLAFPVSASGFGTSSAIRLENAVGSDRIRLGVDPYKMTAPMDGVFPKFAGEFVGESITSKRRFLYVIARDGTVRVVDIFTTEQECNTNVDPLTLPAPYSATTSCIPVGAVGVRGRPYPTDQSGPGLRFPSIPIDVAAVDVRFPADENNNPANEATVAGGYAWVLTSSGAIYLVNIDPVLRQLHKSVEVPVSDPAAKGDHYMAAPDNALPTEPVPFANTRRDRNQVSYSPGLDPASGPPRVATPAPQSIAGPYIESYFTKGSENNSVAQGDEYVLTTAYFPDPSAVTAQSWSVTWEGPLIAGRYGGRIDGETSTLFDGANFCSSGVFADDQVTFTGCTQDNQCIPGFKCHRDPTVTEIPGGFEVTGLCIDPAREEHIESSCPGAFRTLRRYDIEVAHQDRVKLTPHLDELVRSRLAGPCIPNPVPGQNGADGGVDAGVDAAGGDAGTADGGTPDGPAGDGGAAQPPGSSCFDQSDPTTAVFDCVDGPGAASGDAKRCLVRCTADTDCRHGRICLTDVGFCVDAPPLAALSSCLEQLISYRVNAGRSYLVSGSQSGVQATGVEGANDVGCVPDPLLDARMVSRISIDAAECDRTSWPAPFAADSEQFIVRPDEPQTVEQIRAARSLFEVVKTAPNPSPCIFLGGANAVDSTPTNQHVRALFRNSQVAFILTNIDRQPAAGFGSGFDVSGGFRPQSVLYPGTVEVSMPARLVIGPVDSRPQDSDPPSTFEAPYLFVVDQRRLGRSQGGGATRGQILRVNPLIPVTGTTGLQPSYEDFTRSGGLFPIQ